jgi:hypothetical protein
MNVTKTVSAVAALVFGFNRLANAAPRSNTSAGAQMLVLMCKKPAFYADFFMQLVHISETTSQSRRIGRLHERRTYL